MQEFRVSFIVALFSIMYLYLHDDTEKVRMREIIRRNTPSNLTERRKHAKL